MIKLIDILSEWKIIKSPRIHNLDKPGVRFENIQVGDILKFSLDDGDIIMQQVIPSTNIYDVDSITTQYLDEDGNLMPDSTSFWDKIEIENYWSRSNPVFENLNEWKIQSYPFFRKDQEVSLFRPHAPSWMSRPWIKGIIITYVKGIDQLFENPLYDREQTGIVTIDEYRHGHGSKEQDGYFYLIEYKYDRTTYRTWYSESYLKILQDLEKKDLEKK